MLKLFSAIIWNDMVHFNDSIMIHIMNAQCILLYRSLDLSRENESKSWGFF